MIKRINDYKFLVDSWYMRLSHLGDEETMIEINTDHVCNQRKIVTYCEDDISEPTVMTKKTGFIFKKEETVSIYGEARLELYELRMVNGDCILTDKPVIAPDENYTYYYVHKT